ncbi:MAG TPA: DMT family transporter [Rectinemataceae bacterium]|nr:DMT family transporter [Rectinemataceae bacterium]
MKAGLLPILAILAAAALGATSGLYIKGLAFSGLAMSGLRMLVPFLLVLPSVARRGQLLGKKSYRGKLYFASALNAVRMFLYIMAFKFTSMGNAIVLLYLWPVFALIIDSIRLRRPLDMARLGILGLAFGGVVVLNLNRNFSLAGSDLLGSGCMILSALLFAGTAIIFKDALKEVKETDTLYFQNGMGALVFLPFLLSEIPNAPSAHLAIGLLYGFAVGLVGFGLFFYAMKRLPFFQYSALSYCEVPIGLFFGVVFLGEGIRLSQAIGVVMIVAGSFAAQRLRNP